MPHLSTFVDFESQLLMQCLSTSRANVWCHVGRHGESTFGVGAPTLENVGGHVHGTPCKCKSVLLMHLAKGAFVGLQKVP